MTLRWIDHKAGGEPLTRPSKARLHAKLRLIDECDPMGPSFGYARRIPDDKGRWRVYSPWLVNLGTRATLGGAAELLKRHAAHTTS